MHQLCALHKQRVASLIEQQVSALGLPEAKTQFLVAAIGLLKEGAIVSAQLKGDTQSALLALSVVDQLIDTATHAA